jgi:hypothetical protein
MTSPRGLSVTLGITIVSGLLACGERRTDPRREIVFDGKAARLALLECLNGERPIAESVPWAELSARLQASDPLLAEAVAMIIRESGLSDPITIRALTPCTGMPVLSGKQILGTRGLKLEIEGRDNWSHGWIGRFLRGKDGISLILHTAWKRRAD